MALSPIKNGLLALIVIQFLLFLFWQVGFRFRFKRQLTSLVPSQTKKMRWKEVDPLRMAKSVEEDLYRYAPIQYLANQNQPIVHNWTKNSFCGHWPQMHDIEFSNIYWQRLELSQNHSLYLLGAYLDRRITPHSVRVILGKQHMKVVQKLVAQLWFKGNDRAIISNSSSVKYLCFGAPDVPHVWKNHGHSEYYDSFMATFPIPSDAHEQVPLVISVVEKPCNKAGNALKVIHEQPVKKREFAVCTRCLFFPQDDQWMKIIEWIELNLALGASKIFLYILNVGPKIQAVLNLYKDLGVVEHFGLTWPGANPSTPYLQKFFWNNVKWLDPMMDHYALNDCLYRNLDSFEYLAMIDVDEILMPIRFWNWFELIGNATKNDFDNTIADAFIFQNFYFFGNRTDSPLSHLQMIGSNLRSRKGLGQQQTKGFQSTRGVEIAFNHYPISCVGEKSKCKVVIFNESYARMNHYRGDCSFPQVSKEACKAMKNELILDDLVERYKDRILDGFGRTMQNLTNIRDFMHQ